MPVEDARESGAPMSGGVSGPSFLGLAGGSSGSADYLLEDEPSGAWRKWAVLLLLILVGVLGYLQWKTNWRAQPATPPPEQSAPPSTAPQGKAAPASDVTGVPAPSDQQAAKPADSAQPPAGKDSASPPSPEKPNAEDAAASDTASKKSDPASKKKDKDAEADDQKDDSGEQPPAKSQPKPISQARKPAADRSTTTDSQRDPMLYMAQRYLYGQGVRHDCDQAMIYMRAANQKASAPARSQMGALYATGHCVPLDRVRAYQWFTSALNLEPTNPDLQRERNNLWAQMSSSERQQAVK